LYVLALAFATGVSDPRKLGITRPSIYNKRKPIGRKARNGK
jgi:hypothetical protein